MRHYGKGTMIFSEYQEGAPMFIIREGSVKITKIVDRKEVILSILKCGDMFGEMALLENRPRSASAIAMEDCTFLAVNTANFNQIVATQPQMIYLLTTMFADRLWAMNRQLMNTQLTDLREKMVDMVSLQVEKQKLPYDRRTQYDTGLSVSDVINLCAIPKEREAEAAKDFKKIRI